MGPEQKIEICASLVLGPGAGLEDHPWRKRLLLEISIMGTPSTFRYNVFVIAEKGRTS